MSQRAGRKLPNPIVVVVGLTLYVLLAIWVLNVLGLQRDLASDFVIYTAAARAALQRSSAYYPYNIGYSFVYHPAVLSALSPLLPLGDGGAFVVWTIGSLIAYAALLRWEFQRWGIWILILLLLFAPALENLLVGQINIFTALAIVVTWRCAERGRDRAAGL